jgi:hypothetical protein
MDEPTKLPPRLFDHCCNIFTEMRQEAKPTKVGGEHALVYEGYTTRLFQKLQLPGPYYTSVLQRLQGMGCIRQLSRGGGSSPSRWMLLEDPTIEAFAAAEEPASKPTRLEILEQRVTDLEQRASGE